MKTSVPLMFVFCLCAVAAAHAAPVSFRAKPVVHRTGPTATIQFALSAGTDVEVAILNARGEVVRHLAAGLLGGKSPPPPPLVPGLSQKIEWDGLDDYGDRVANVASCSVRVRAGMSGKLQQIVGGDPYAVHSKEMGQGDHAAWRITGLEAKADGSVYLLANANNYGPAVLRKYDAAGNYVHTVYPPPAGKPIEQVAGWGTIAQPDGTYLFKYSDLESPALSETMIAGIRGRTASLIPSPEPNRLLLTQPTKAYALMQVHVDGTIPRTPPLAGALVNEPSMSPASKAARPAWELTGQLQASLSPDGKHLYVGGIYAAAVNDRGSIVGAEPNSFWRDGQIYKVELATRKASVFFALGKQSLIAAMDARQKSPIADARYGKYAALHGVATDAEGNVFVCDRQNERIVVLDRDGKTLREIPISHPDAIVVGRKSPTLYVTTRKGHYHAKGEMRLVKFADWRKDSKPSQVIPLCEVHHYRQPTLLAIAEAGGQSYLWVAYTSLPVRIYREGGTGLELVKDFYEAGPQRALDLQHFTVDQKTDDVYVADGFGSCFKIADWSDPTFVRCMQDSKTPLNALGLAIDSRNRFLYGRADRKPVVRYRLDGEFHWPAPLAGASKEQALTPMLQNDWRIGLGKTDRGLAAAPDGSLATLAAVGKKSDYMGYLQFFAAKPGSAPWNGIPFKDFQKVRAAGVRFDPRGNLYAGKVDRPPPTPPPGFERDANFRQTTGRIFKYAPTGSLKAKNLFPTEPAAPAKVYDVHYGPIVRGFSRTPRFGVDGYGRIYYPTALLSRVSVIDNQGNPLLAFGTYGNRDSQGGLAGDLVPTKDIPLAWPNCVDATDDYIYVSDIVNIRLLRIAKTFEATEKVQIPSGPDGK